jgi:hypothetical protein
MCLSGSRNHLHRFPFRETAPTHPAILSPANHTSQTEGRLATHARASNIPGKATTSVSTTKEPGCPQPGRFRRRVGHFRSRIAGRGRPGSLITREVHDNHLSMPFPGWRMHPPERCAGALFLTTLDLTGKFKKKPEGRRILTVLPERSLLNPCLSTRWNRFSIIWSRAAC